VHFSVIKTINGIIRDNNAFTANATINCLHYTGFGLQLIDQFFTVHSLTIFFLKL